MNVGDGDVDAFIDEALPADEDIFSRGSTVFLVKYADLLPNACRKELHASGDIKSSLKEELFCLLEQGASYVPFLCADITNVQTLCQHKAIEKEVAVQNLYRANAASFSLRDYARIQLGEL